MLIIETVKKGASARFDDSDVIGLLKMIWNGRAVSRSGGSGCTTWVMRGGRLLMAPEWDVDANDPRSAAAIRGSVSMAEGDVLVIGGGPTRRAARAAAVGAALSLVG